MDVHNKKTRSYNMSRIRSENTKPEILVRKYLFSKGFRYRLHVRKLPGKPDIVLPRYRILIFVNGCFWHGHDGCNYYVIPKTRTEWWRRKINRTKERDRNNILKLRNMNWKVITIFECELKKGIFEDTMEKLIEEIEKSDNTNN